MRAAVRGRPARTSRWLRKPDGSIMESIEKERGYFGCDFGDSNVNVEGRIKQLYLPLNDQLAIDFHNSITTGFGPSNIIDGNSRLMDHDRDEEHGLILHPDGKKHQRTVQIDDVSAGSKAESAGPAGQDSWAL